MAISSRGKLTAPDLVLLSLLAERPLYGYQANTVLEFRKWRDWISRPQVYYSLDKLSRLGLIRASSADSVALGPERAVYETTAKGRSALADALERDDWIGQEDRPPFLIWLALSWQCRPGVFVKQLHKRRVFLETELARKQEILRAVLKEVGHRYHEAVWMLSLNIDRIRTELRWLKKVSRESARRSSAHHPAYPEK
jgi:DNA-binding PadR family transcriptional regulator